MYEAMANAPVGDDVLGDDPTVMELENLGAKKVGKEAALFVPSGTMGNQIALACHCNRGDAILIEEEAHILFYEVGAPAILAGVVSWTLPSTNGVMDPNNVERHITKANLHTPGTTLLCLENTHNRAGGAIIPTETMAAYAQIANKAGIKVHLDGARVFNAAIALNQPVTQITQHVDTVSFCLSKGLGSPIGSLLCGDSNFIDKARIWRKRLGGGMRQAGVLAACGIVSLNEMIDRLADDHANAKLVANGLIGIPGIEVDLDSVQTNMVLVNTTGPSTEWMAALKEEGLLSLPPAPDRLRLVFHADVSREKAEKAIEIFQKVSGLMKAA